MITIDDLPDIDESSYWPYGHRATGSGRDHPSHPSPFLVTGLWQVSGCWLLWSSPGRRCPFPVAGYWLLLLVTWRGSWRGSWCCVAGVQVAGCW